MYKYFFVLFKKDTHIQTKENKEECVRDKNTL